MGEKGLNKGVKACRRRERRSADWCLRWDFLCWPPLLTLHACLSAFCSPLSHTPSMSPFFHLLGVCVCVTPCPFPPFSSYTPPSLVALPSSSPSPPPWSPPPSPSPSVYLTVIVPSRLSPSAGVSLSPLLNLYFDSSHTLPPSRLDASLPSLFPLPASRSRPSFSLLDRWSQWVITRHHEHLPAKVSFSCWELIV